ncbi:spore coat protein [Halanaerobaculum tunisiense]
MPSLLNALMQNGSQLTDQTIANDMLAGSKQAANTYLTAILECSTPELRTMYSNSLNQVLAGHEALTSLAVNRGWYQPYEAPDEQLAKTLNQSQTLVNSQQANRTEGDSANQSRAQILNNIVNPLG